MQPMFGNNTVQDLQKLSSHDVGMLVYNTFTDGHVAFFIAFLQSGMLGPVPRQGVLD